MNFILSNSYSPYVPRLVRGIHESGNIDGSRGQAAGRRGLGGGRAVNCILNMPKYFYTLLLLFITLILSSCIDLSGTRLHSVTTSKNTLKDQKNSLYRGEVHTMRGGLGIFSIGMNQLREKVDAQYHVTATSIMWYNAGNVSRSVANYYYQHKRHRPIILIGHSLGANEQIKVARALDKIGIPVDLLVTVDAVSQTIVPPNVKQVLNVYKPGYVPMFSGLKLRAVNPVTTRIENVNVNDLKGMHVNHFTIDKDKAVQAMILNKIERVLRNAN